MAKKVAIYIADGTEPVEVITPADILSRGGIEVVFVSVKIGTSVVLAQNIHIEADVAIGEFEPSPMSMLLVPGGSDGVKIMAQNQMLIDQVAAFLDSSDRYVGSICAGPTILANNGLLEGRKATCYPGCEEGFPLSAYQADVKVVVDGNLITATGPGSAAQFGLALLSALEGDTVAREVAAAMLID